MWRTFPLLLCVLLVAPWPARAQEDEATGGPEEDEARPKKKARASDDEVDGAAPKKKARADPKRKKKGREQAAPEKADEPAKVATPAATDQPQVSAAPEPEQPKAVARHRYGYVIGGGFLVTGLAFAYSAQGEAKRAETIGTAREASQALDNARASAATANVIYGAAAATLVVALLFEVLPAPVAEKASLTFHF